MSLDNISLDDNVLDLNEPQGTLVLNGREARMLYMMLIHAKQAWPVHVSFDYDLEYNKITTKVENMIGKIHIEEMQYLEHWDPQEENLECEENWKCV